MRQTRLPIILLAFSQGKGWEYRAYSVREDEFMLNVAGMVEGVDDWWRGPGY